MHCGTHIRAGCVGEGRVRIAAVNRAPVRHLGVASASAAADPADLIAQIRQLHSPAVVCRGCCSLLCCGDCDWADEYGGELLTVCAHCCIDSDERKQSYPCLDYHDHGAEPGPQPTCAPAGILDEEN